MNVSSKINQQDLENQQQNKFKLTPSGIPMGIEDTFGYRFVRTSLVLLNGLILLRLLSLLLQFNHEFDAAFTFFIILISANFACAVMAALRENRVAVILTGSVTLIMFLSLIFTPKEPKNVNVFLLILLAVSVQSLIFSEMLKERQIFLLRRQRFLENVNRNGTFRMEDGRRLTAVVVTYPTESSPARLSSGAVFTLDPELSNELAKDPPPPYFSAANLPPPKYEDAVQLNASSLPGSSTNHNNLTSNSQLEEQSSISTPARESPTTTVTASSPDDDSITSPQVRTSDNEVIPSSTVPSSSSKDISNLVDDKQTTQKASSSDNDN